MPLSKREKEVSLTKVKKKTREAKESLVEELRKAIDKYANLFVYSVENNRSAKFVQIRQKFKSNSRFFFGKNNVMRVALGKSSTDEYADHIHKVGERLKGQCGIMLTNSDKEEVVSYFNSLRDPDFARTGLIAPETIRLEEGPLKQFSFSVELQLRKLGLPTKLEKGVVHLTQDYTVCTEGDALSADQAKLLKMLNEKLACFHVKLTANWSKSEGFKDIV